MSRTHILMTVVMAVCLASALPSQELDKGYVTAFGWGTAAVAQTQAPALAQYDASLFHFQNSKFFITAGDDQNLHCRFLLKGGKPYSFYMNALKKSTNKKVATLKDEYLRTMFYVSHDEAGSQLFTEWPSSISELPKWKEIGTNEIRYEPAANWVSSRFTLLENRADMTAFISWIKRARPGWKIYVVHVAGYRREAPELKYWDKALLKWMIPLEYVDTEPLAVATVEVEKSTNPMLAWSYTIETMPAERKGVKDGVMNILKDGSKVTSFKFGIKYEYQNEVTKLHNFYVHYEYEDGIVVGGFYANEVPSIEAGIQNTFYEAIARAMSEEKLR